MLYRGILVFGGGGGGCIYIQEDKTQAPFRIIYFGELMKCHRAKALLFLRNATQLSPLAFHHLDT